jgi:transposase-like protein
VDTEALSIKYMRSGGIRCPNCDSDQIEGDGPFEADADWVSHKIRCRDCEASWDDIFTLTGLANFDAPRTDERNIE